MSGEEINAAADALCRRARAREQLVDERTEQLVTRTQERDRLSGALGLCLDRLELDPDEPQRWPLWLRSTLDLALVGGGVGLGYCVSGRCSGELLVGLAVFEAGVLVTRLLFEFL